MLDTVFRPLINRPLDAAGRYLARRGISANSVTLTGLATGLLAAACIATGFFLPALALILLNRVLDGLDGAVARAGMPTDSGGYLDIVVDYVFYGAVPLAFALHDPAQNALPAAALLASFCLTCASFLAYATIAEKRNMTTDAHGAKSFFYSTGIVEGSETIAIFVLMALLPAQFPLLASVFAGLCVLTALQRTALALRIF